MDNDSNSIRDRNRLVALASIALAITLVSGAVYGRWTQRWGPTADLDAAAVHLATLPKQIGDWRMLEDRPLAKSMIEILECAGAVSRSYVDQRTGAVVDMAVIVGPPGPTSVHTPEICYSSRAFEITEPRVKAWFKSPDGSTNSLWSTTFRSHDAGKERMRVYYGWSLGERWIASESPRFEFGGTPLLYKIQVAALIGAVDDEKSNDPCRSFMDALLAAFTMTPDASSHNH